MGARLNDIGEKLNADHRVDCDGPDSFSRECADHLDGRTPHFNAICLRKPCKVKYLSSLYLVGEYFRPRGCS